MAATRTEEGGHRGATLVALAVACLFYVPYWWVVTSPVRHDLPAAAIQQLRVTAPTPLSLPWFMGNGSENQTLPPEHFQRLALALARWNVKLPTEPSSHSDDALLHLHTAAGAEAASPGLDFQLRLGQLESRGALSALEARARSGTARPCSAIVVSLRQKDCPLVLPPVNSTILRQLEASLAPLPITVQESVFVDDAQACYEPVTVPTSSCQQPFESEAIRLASLGALQHLWRSSTVDLGPAALVLAMAHAARARSRHLLIALLEEVDSISNLNIPLDLQRQVGSCAAVTIL
ncbi:uncharacterized protein MONBRDRAFT_8148 [Monosiga brevicollis MX1]|uniref:GPI transamidase component PIG-S n=1 Tax=Monosiga brevicollis TaxID=81824 RepID=A9UZ65_MONBE|nr:uncharacterized protein MONBRDRAFT_8148 [Monosiga brevicollis MX1]EDQ89312.1 predicted protein [Monosiga brevicollis MX1]|eukprot:XP_001745888.1 hypothetical protein [Monosiga brevicollis MX1]